MKSALAHHSLTAGPNITRSDTKILRSLNSRSKLKLNGALSYTDTQPLHEQNRPDTQM